jgi:uncharacterized protein (TIGR02391 family)
LTGLASISKNNMPDLTASQKLIRLAPILKQALEMQGKMSRDAEFEIWLNNANNALDKVFGSNSALSGSLRALPFKYARPYTARGVDYTKADKPESDAQFRHDVQVAIGILRGHIAELELEVQEQETPARPELAHTSLAHLHPTVQQVADSLFATSHYSQAIQVACTALEKAIQHKAGQSASLTGTALLGKVFPKDNPSLLLSNDQGECEGYGFLYRGLLQAIRNHYSHNLTEIPAPRALEWLGFISALFYKLDEAQPPATSHLGLVVAGGA